MKVWLVYAEDPESGATILGIFDDRRLAVEYHRSVPNSFPPGYDGEFVFVELELNRPADGHRFSAGE